MAFQKGKKYGADSNAPANNAFAVTIDSAGTTDTSLSRAVYVGTAGDLAVTMAGGSSVTFKSVPAGTVLSISITQIDDSNTTADDIVVLV